MQKEKSRYVMYQMSSDVGHVLNLPKDLCSRRFDFGDQLVSMMKEWGASPHKGLL